MTCRIRLREKEIAGVNRCLRLSSLSKLSLRSTSGIQVRPKKDESAGLNLGEHYFSQGLSSMISHKHAKHAKHGGGTELADSRVELVCFAATSCRSIYCIH